jgi:hypothetical protein
VHGARSREAPRGVNGNTPCIRSLLHTLKSHQLPPKTAHSSSFQNELQYARIQYILNTLAFVRGVLSSMQPPEVRRMFQKHDRQLKRELQRDKQKLFQALEEFANIRPDKEAWAHFRKRWPKFFPEEEYDRVAEGSKPSIVDYPYCLDRLWVGMDSPLRLMLGIDTASYRVDELLPEDMWEADLAPIAAKFDLDWDEGVFRFQGACNFQRALYLLFRESWRARICEKCETKFIARRVAQKYCSTECSGSVQRELKQKWWAEHGETWRRRRKESKWKRSGRQNGPRKAR